MSPFNNHSAFIWSVADLLRGDYEQSEYGRVILPFTVLRRLDCVIAPVKGDMLDRYDSVKDTLDNYGPVLDRLTDTWHLWERSGTEMSGSRTPWFERCRWSAPGSTSAWSAMAGPARGCIASSTV